MQLRHEPVGTRGDATPIVKPSARKAQRDLGGVDLPLMQAGATHDADLASTIKERQLAPDIFLWVTDIDSVYAQHRAAKADIAEELAMRPWGVRQYVVREPNGYLLKVAESQKEEEEEPATK